MVPSADWLMCSLFAAAIHALTLYDGHDSALLNITWAIETVFVKALNELALQIHLVEGCGSLLVVGFNPTCGQQ